MSASELHPSGLPVGLARPSDASTFDRAAGADKDRASATLRLREIIDRHCDFVWRTVRYLGVEESGVEDAAQQVLCILARRLGEVAPGAEMSFLFSTAVRVASETRRAARRRPAADDAEVDALVATMPSPEELIDERRARDVLHAVLEAIPTDLRVVFVLFEIEELSLAQIAALVGIPNGTAASRLRRARERFHGIVRRMHARQAHRASGGGQ